MHLQHFCFKSGDTADSHKKWLLSPLEWRHILGSSFYLIFWTQKCVKIMTIYCWIFNKRNIYSNRYLFIFDTKLSIFPHKVRQVLASQDVQLCLTANYLHKDIFDPNLKKVWIFCVSLLYMLSSCKVFSPVWWPRAAVRWERKQEIQSSPPEVALEGDGTAD